MKYAIKMWQQLRISVIMLTIFVVVTGIIYPFTVTGFAWIVSPDKSSGSLIEKDGRILGSELIGQPFSDPKYFWGRLSATQGYPYNSESSSGSNLAPSNPAFKEAIQARVDALKLADPGNSEPIPIDLVTFSASGLDPHISIAAAYYQAPRVARNRGLSPEEVFEFINIFTENRQLGFLGEPRVNILKVNLALDRR